MMDSATLIEKLKSIFHQHYQWTQFLQCCLSEIKFSCVKQLAFEDASTFLTEAIHHFLYARNLPLTICDIYLVGYGGHAKFLQGSVYLYQLIPVG